MFCVRHIYKILFKPTFLSDAQMEILYMILFAIILMYINDPDDEEKRRKRELFRLLRSRSMFLLASYPRKGADPIYLSIYENPEGLGSVEYLDSLISIMNSLEAFNGNLKYYGMVGEDVNQFLEHNRELCKYLSDQRVQLALKDGVVPIDRILDSLIKELTYKEQSEPLRIIFKKF